MSQTSQCMTHSSTSKVSGVTHNSSRQPQCHRQVSGVTHSSISKVSGMTHNSSKEPQCHRQVSGMTQQQPASSVAECTTAEPQCQNQGLVARPATADSHPAASVTAMGHMVGRHTVAAAATACATHHDSCQHLGRLAHTWQSLVTSSVNLPHPRTQAIQARHQSRRPLDAWVLSRVAESLEGSRRAK